MEGAEMVGPEEIKDPTKVTMAANAMLEKHGDHALKRARYLEATSSAKAFAAAVRMEIERRLRPNSDN